MKILFFTTSIWNFQEKDKHITRTVDLMQVNFDFLCKLKVENN